jgi:hypothetical protein
MGDVVGTGTPGLVKRVVVETKELEREGVTLVGVTVGIEEEEVVVGRRLEDGVGVEVGELAGTIEEESGGAGCTDLDESPFQTNWQEPFDKAFSTLSQT